MRLAPQRCHHVLNQLLGGRRIEAEPLVIAVETGREMIEQPLECGAITVLRDRGHQVRIVVRGRHQPASAPADRSAAVGEGRNLIGKKCALRDFPEHVYCGHAGYGICLKQAVNSIE
jgi:hypothetical protein